MLITRMEKRKSLSDSDFKLGQMARSQSFTMLLFGAGPDVSHPVLYIAPCLYVGEITLPLALRRSLCETVHKMKLPSPSHTALMPRRRAVNAAVLTGSPFGPFSPGAPIRAASPCGYREVRRELLLLANALTQGGDTFPNRHLQSSPSPRVQDQEPVVPTGGGYPLDTRAVGCFPSSLAAPSLHNPIIFIPWQHVMHIVAVGSLFENQATTCQHFVCRQLK